jgi:hypothetical protein
MNEFKALLVAQVLLVLAGSRLKLKECHSAGDDYYRFRVQGRRGISPKLVMPVVAQTQGLAVKSLLDETSGKRHSWHFNGQAEAGFKQLAHFGHSGRVVCSRSKSDLTNLFGAEDDLSLTQTCRSIIASAPDVETLVVYDQNEEPTSYMLPTDQEALILCDALMGDLVAVTDVDRFMDLVKTFGLGLTFVTENGQCFMPNVENSKARKQTQKA